MQCSSEGFPGESSPRTGRELKGEPGCTFPAAPAGHSLINFVALQKNIGYTLAGAARTQL